MVENITAFARTVTSGPATQEVYEQRLATCQACDKLKQDGGKLYCGACGCPEWRLAELHTKLKFSGLRCPAGKFTE